MVRADVDHFKRYNDTNGHVAGDQVLSAVGQLLVETVGADVQCARYGGEEFVALLPETKLTAAGRMAEKIRKRIEAHPFQARETQPGGAVTVSLGVAALSKDDADGSALIRRADEALYRAKDQGRNRVESGS